MITAIFFKDVEKGKAFYFGELTYIKNSEDNALSIAGLREFNHMEIVGIYE